MTQRKITFSLCFLFLINLSVSIFAAQQMPSMNGLQLWLDAADKKTVITDDNGLITKWLDKSGKNHHALPADSAKIKLAPAAMNNKDVVRFNGCGYFNVQQIRNSPGEITVFIVFQRLPQQVTDTKHQRLLSSWDGTSDSDHKRPAFSIGADHNNTTQSYGPLVYDMADSDVKIGPLAIGANIKYKNQFFSGDIAEILIYDRGFVTEDHLQTVLRYLSEKWNAKIIRSDKGWTRTGKLGKTPKRITDSLPLSDQLNTGNWEKYEPLCDEFNGTALDTSKWIPELNGWKGRQPAFFSPDNITVSKGKLHITMRNQELPQMPKDEGYHTYTSAVLRNKEKVRYGYFEVRAKPMKSAGCSAFWFATDDAPNWTTEIDVFEIGGKAKGFERKLNMNVHVFQTPQEKRHWNKGGVWLAPWNLANDYHVYGLEWDEKEIKYYVDGVIVRKTDNTHWHNKLFLIFDSETMPDWLGLPDLKDLPSTYSIDYIRTWKTKS